VGRHPRRGGGRRLRPAALAGWQAGWLAAGWLLPAGSRNQPHLNG